MSLRTPPKTAAGHNKLPTPQSHLDSSLNVQVGVKMRRQKLFKCDDRSPRSYMGQRGSFWVLYNYIVSSEKFDCDETITYTTIGDVTSLHNLQPLLERWLGPISLSIYAPKSDYKEVMTRIQYLRHCSSTPLIKKWVTFHIFFDGDKIPPKIQKIAQLNNKKKNKIDCSKMKGTKNMLKKLTRNKELYPLNVARNIAREMALTHYILASDIELYPSYHLIPQFLAMIHRKESHFRRPTRKVWPLAVFEVNETLKKVPGHKNELLQLYGKGLVLPFHTRFCERCHRIPGQDRWLKPSKKTKNDPGSKINVLEIAKRHYPFQSWEPFYIGTHSEPLFDERLHWGDGDKMVQAYTLCLLDYEFHVLDNAFLAHSPGFKTLPKNTTRTHLAMRQSDLIWKIIRPELHTFYGQNAECMIPNYNTTTL